MPVITSPFPETFSLANVDGQNGFKFTGENAYDQSGVAVYTAGDINGDGVSDLIVGANTAYNYFGASYVVFGQTENWTPSFSLSILNGTNGVKLIGENGVNYCGNSVSAVGDVNGDGISDFIIGDNNYPNALSSAGASYLMFGHTGDWINPFSLSNLNGVNGVKFTGENPADSSGTSVSAAGDVNGDGIADFIIGAPHANGDEGGSYLVFGHTGSWTTPFSLSALNGNNGVKFTGHYRDTSGFSVSSAGDVNGDGISDLIFGAPSAGYAGYAGGAYILFGHSGSWTTPYSLSSLDGTNGLKLVGENIADQCGCSVSAAGDVNGDGIGDVIIGALGANTYTGVSYLVFGHTGSWITPFNLTALNGVNGIKFLGENPGDQFGGSVSTARDINGDGIADLIIGAQVANGAFGTSYLLFGHKGNWATPFALSNLNATTGVKFNGEHFGDYSGNSVGTAGDVNGDGVSDLMIGAATYSGSLARQGASYVIFGRNVSYVENQSSTGNFVSSSGISSSMSSSADASITPTLSSTGVAGNVDASSSTSIAGNTNAPTGTFTNMGSTSTISSSATSSSANTAMSAGLTMATSSSAISAASTMTAFTSISSSADASIIPTLSSTGFSGNVDASSSTGVTGNTNAPTGIFTGKEVTSTASSQSGSTGATSGAARNQPWLTNALSFVNDLLIMSPLLLHYLGKFSSSNKDRLLIKTEREQLFNINLMLEKLQADSHWLSESYVKQSSHFDDKLNYLEVGFDEITNEIQRALSMNQCSTNKIKVLQAKAERMVEIISDLENKEKQLQSFENEAQLLKEKHQGKQQAILNVKLNAATNVLTYEILCLPLNTNGDYSNFAVELDKINALIACNSAMSFEHTELRAQQTSLILPMKGSFDKCSANLVELQDHQPQLNVKPR